MCQGAKVISITFFALCSIPKKWFQSLFCFWRLPSLIPPSPSNLKLETWNFDHFFSTPFWITFLDHFFRSLFSLLCSTRRKSDFNHFFILGAKPKKVIWITFISSLCAKSLKWFQSLFCSVRQAEKSDLNHFLASLCAESQKWVQSLFCSCGKP